MAQKHKRFIFIVEALTLSVWFLVGASSPTFLSSSSTPSGTLLTSLELVFSVSDAKLRTNQR